jgi:Xaa-Pro aminopeptidase
MEKKLPDMWKHIPNLSLEERDARWEKIRARMSGVGLDCLLVWSGGGGHIDNIRYVAHVGVPGICLFPLNGEPVVFSARLRSYYYIKGQHRWVQDVRPGPSPSNVARALADLGLAKGNIGIVGFGSSRFRHSPDVINYRSYKGLLEALPGANLVDAGWLLDELRMVKSAGEIEFLYKAAELAYKMFEAMANSARPGVKECEVYANMLHASLSNGGDDEMILLDSGNPPLLHGKGPPYTTRPLEKGDIIIVEYHANYGGYLIAVEHSLSLGKPKKQFREIHRVSEECYHQGVSAMRPGVSFEEMIQAFREPADRAGMAYIELGVCGHGLSSPEFPSCVYGGKGGVLHEHGLAQIAPIRLQENMVFGINVDLHNPKFSTDTGLMLGDTIWVTADGPKQMTRIPVEFTVV